MTALVPHLPRGQLLALLDVQGWHCAACGRRLPPLGDCALPDDHASFDHVYPRSKGGSDSLLNGLAMHRRCNTAKGDRLPTGCERIWHELVLASLGVGYGSQQGSATLADVWPTEKVAPSR